VGKGGLLLESEMTVLESFFCFSGLLALFDRRMALMKVLEKAVAEFLMGYRMAVVPACLG
jgi:hypothetical protein